MGIELSGSHKVWKGSHPHMLCLGRKKLILCSKTLPRILYKTAEEAE